MDEKKLGKYISLILRHHPEAAGITLDEHGWADVEELIAGICQTGRMIDRDVLDRIVAENNKQRYSYNADGTKIRANQGHSIPVDVELKEAVPPEALYHGTAKRFLEKILSEGLKPMSRLYVHLSPDVETAVRVGKRHGDPIVLLVESGKMYRDGCAFFLSENGVWLTKAVMPEYLRNCRTVVN